MRIFRKVCSILSSILVALMVLLALLLVGARVVGLRVFTVLSGSMEPTYHTGSMIYVKKVDPYSIQVGDPITFMLDENTIATHRVVGIVPDEEDPTVIRFRTKGDANEAEDGGLVHYKNVVGTPIFSIPKLGYFADYIQHPPGMYIAISGGAILLLLVFIPDIFADDKDKKEKEKKPRRSQKAKPLPEAPAELPLEPAPDVVPIEPAPDYEPLPEADAPSIVDARPAEQLPPPPQPTPDKPTASPSPKKSLPHAEPTPQPSEAPAAPDPSEALREEIRRKTEGLLTEREVDVIRQLVESGRYDDKAAAALRTLLLHRLAEKEKK